MRLARYGIEYKQKLDCPRCGYKTFVPYFDPRTNLLITEYGRCDRERKCAYHKKPPKQNNEFRGFVPFKRKKEQLEKQGEPLGAKYNDLPCDDYDNPLFCFLSSYFTEEAVFRVFELYQVRYYKGYVWFPQIDKDGVVWTAKGLWYRRDGHRAREKPPTWLHAWKGFTGVANRVLFGSHLVEEGGEVWVVESEKTALVCSLFFDFKKTFVATGGLNGLRAEHFNGVECVILVPDTDGVERWLQKVSNGDWVGRRVYVYDIRKDLPYSDGDDIADVIINYLKEQ